MQDQQLPLLRLHLDRRRWRRTSNEEETRRKEEDEKKKVFLIFTTKKMKIRQRRCLMITLNIFYKTMTHLQLHLIDTDKVETIHFFLNKCMEKKRIL